MAFTVFIPFVWSMNFRKFFFLYLACSIQWTGAYLYIFNMLRLFCNSNFFWSLSDSMKSYSMIFAVFMFSFVHDFNTFAFVYYLFQLFCLPNIFQRLSLPLLFLFASFSKLPGTSFRSLFYCCFILIPLIFYVDLVSSVYLSYWQSFFLA